MLSVTLDGRRLALEGITVAEADALDGKSGPHVIAALLERAGLDPAAVRNGDLELNDDDTLPTIYQDGIPTTGGRVMDAYVVAFARQPWCWPPTVTRRQTLRDLALILDALETA